jgi:hypothetical protein
VLSLYDFELIREVTDPRTGICTTEKYMSFMPNAGELKVYCDALVARRDRFEKLAELGRVDFSRARLPAPPEGPGARATVFVPASNSRYAALLEWSKTADPLLFKFEQRPGIWVVRFAENQAAIFDAIWNAGEAGIVSTERFMQAVYGGRVHGGPDNFNVISVTLIRMRKLMALSGYTITQNMGVPRQGWRIVKLPVVQQGEAAE